MRKHLLKLQVAVNAGHIVGKHRVRQMDVKTGHGGLVCDEVRLHTVQRGKGMAQLLVEGRESCQQQGIAVVTKNALLVSG